MMRLFVCNRFGRSCPEALLQLLKHHAGSARKMFFLMSLTFCSFPGYGVLKLDVKTKSQSGVVSTAVVSVSVFEFHVRDSQLPIYHNG